GLRRLRVVPAGDERAARRAGSEVGDRPAGHPPGRAWRRSTEDGDAGRGRARRRRLPRGRPAHHRRRRSARRHPRDSPGDDRMTDKDTLALYEKTGALLRGHFKLTSGLHSDIYLQSALVLQHPEHAETLGRALAEAFRDAHVRTVLAPAIGGIIVAHEVARALGTRALFTEREGG